MWHNPELSDYFDNHVAVQSRAVDANSPNHLYTMAATTNIPDMTDMQTHHVRVVYKKEFDDSILKPENCSQTYSCNKFQSTSHVGLFTLNSCKLNVK